MSQSPTIGKALAAWSEYQRLLQSVIIPSGTPKETVEAGRESREQAHDQIARLLWKQRRQRWPESQSERWDMRAVKRLWRDICWAGYPSPQTLRLPMKRDFDLYAEVQRATMTTQRGRRSKALFEDPAKKTRRLAAEALEVDQ